MRFVLTVLIFFFTATLFADENSTPNKNAVVILPSNAVHNGNYFAMGSSVEISGVVNGDVYVLAEQVIIDGTVNGDVLGCGGSIDISGKVAQNCRVIAGQVLISGAVGRNVTVVGGNLQLLSSGVVKGSLVATAGNVELAAEIGSDATVLTSNLRLSSHIKGNLQGYVGNMRITSRAVIDGDVDYRSHSTAWIEPGAVIRGTVTHHPSFVHNLVKGTWIQGLLVGSKVLVILMNFIYTLVIGMVLIKIFPKNLEAALFVLKERPMKALSYGIVVLFLLPLSALILLMTVIGVPFALALIALNVIGFYTAKVYSIFWVSNWAFRKLHARASFLLEFVVGSILYFCLTAIPIFGSIVAVAAMLFGIGAGVLAQTKHGIFNLSLPSKKS